MEKYLSRYETAKIEADKIDSQIIETLCSGRSFRVEAGAGSGKTYSLNKVIEWLQDNRWNEFNTKKQKVACITYTNAAVDVIVSRLKPNSFIVPSTIHSFAWNAISQFQSTIIQLIKDNDLLPQEGDINDVNTISYTLGHRYIDNNTMYLYHNDVITLFSAMLDNLKFRAIFARTYPVILIDEYQDSFKNLIDKFLLYYITVDKGPQFGFFGDSWQTIYQSNNACGLIDDEHLVEIKKVSNFRSAPEIVKLLNKLRPELQQISAIDDFQGEVLVITSDDYTGIRRTDRNFKDDLPVEVLEQRLSKIEEHLRKTKIGDGESLKILMITHKVLATQQGYDKLLDLLGDGFRNSDDHMFVFFMNLIEPVYEALQTNNMTLLFDTLGIRRYPINTKAQKAVWIKLQKDLDVARKKTVKDVLDVSITSKLIPIPPKIDEYYRDILLGTEKPYQNGVLQDLSNILYSEFVNAINFLKPTAVFSTEHGVKGEEYDNVIFVIGRGWNNYQFDNYMPMNKSTVPEDKKASYERNRNLFYVCCSRPQKRLVLFITIPTNGQFKAYLDSLVGVNRIITYTNFISEN